MLLIRQVFIIWYNTLMAEILIILISCILIFIIGAKLKVYLSMPLVTAIILFLSFLELKLDPDNLSFFWTYSMMMLFSAVVSIYLKLYFHNNQPPFRNE